MTSDRGARAVARGGWRFPLMAGAALLTVGVASFLAVAAGLGGKSAQSADRAERPQTLERLEAGALPLVEVAAGLEASAEPAELDAQRDALAAHLYLSNLAVGLRSAAGRMHLTNPRRPAPRVKGRAGDTRMGTLTRAGADRKAAYQAVEARGSEYDPRRLRPGQEIALALRGPEWGALTREWL